MQKITLTFNLQVVVSGIVISYASLQCVVLYTEVCCEICIAHCMQLVIVVHILY